MNWVDSWGRVGYETVLLWTGDDELLEPLEGVALGEFFEDEVLLLFAVELAVELFEILGVLEVDQVPYAGLDQYIPAIYGPSMRRRQWQENIHLILKLLQMFDRLPN